MTSPTQLKYLDAMGIPVWVSRDLVVDTKNVININTVATEGVIEPLEKGVGEHQSAKSLLQNLDNQTKDNGRKKVSNYVSEVKSKTVVSKQSNTLNNIEIQSTEIGRTILHTVYACGSLQADWLVVGESPETVLDRINQPFENNTGVLLCNMLRAVGIENPRDNAYLINVLKIPNIQSINTNQTTKELNQLLINKIEQIKPKIILAVGQIAAQNLLQSNEPLARLRAKVHQLPSTDIPVIATYYPSWLLSKPKDKRKAWEDLKLAMRTISSD